jgi:copper(I)-binding protein
VFLTVALLSIVLSACGGGGGAGTAQIELSDAAIGATDSTIAAMYLTVSNQGDGADALVAAKCSCAGAITLHLTDDSDGISRMVGTDRLEIEPGGSVTLDPAGSHLMLERLRNPLVEGTTVEVRLEFDRSEPHTIEVPVVGLASLAERVGA